MEQDKKYFVFISYSNLDNEWAVWLRHELEHYHLPASFNGRTDVRDSLREVFRDRDELSAGPEWDQQVHKALENTNNLIVICSPHSAKSEAVNKEVEDFIAMGKGDHIFPFIVEGNSPDEYFPKSLDHNKVGGDVNRDGGRDAAFVKVVSGMLRINFSDLWNRYELEKAEEERKQREQRENLQRVQSNFLAEKAVGLVSEGNSYLAQRLLLCALPSCIEKQDRPYVSNAEKALRTAVLQGNTIINIQEPFSILVCPDGQHIVASLINKPDIMVVNLWNGSIVRRFSTPWVNCIIKISNDGKLIAFCEKCGWQIKVLDFLSGKHISDITLEGDFIDTDKYSYDYIYDFDFSVNGDRIAVSTTNEKHDCMYKTSHTTSVWEIGTGRHVFSLGWLKGSCSIVKFSSDNKWLVTDDGIWDAETGQLKRAMNLSQQPLSLSQNGKMVASPHFGTVKIWDLNTGERIHTLEVGVSSNNTVMFSRDDKYVAVSYNDGIIRIWDLEKEKISEEICVKGEYLHTALFCSNDKQIICQGLNGKVRLFDTKQNVALRHCKIKNFSLPLLSNENGHFVSYYDQFSKELIRVTNTRNSEDVLDIECHNDEFRKVYSLSINHNESRVVLLANTLNNRGELDPGILGIRIIDVVSGAIITEKKHLYESHITICSAVWSTRDKMLAGGTISGHIYVWDEFGEELFHFELEKKDEIVFIAFSPDDKKIVVCTSEGDAYIYDIESEKITHHIRCDKTTFSLSCAVFSSDSSTLYIGSERGCFFIYSIDSMRITYSSEEETGSVRSMALSPNEKYLVVGYGASRYQFSSHDNVVRIFDLSSCSCIQVVDDFSQTVIGVDFKTANSLLGVSCDGEVTVWDFPSLQELIDDTRERFKDSPLTPEERRKYYLE